MYVDTQLFYILYTIIQIPIFYAFWHYYLHNQQFKCSCKKFSISFPLAKASAALISYNLSILILSIIKFYKKYIFIPIYFVHLHYITVFYIYSWTIVHSVAHYINFQKLHDPPYFTWGVGFTGHFLLGVLLLLPIFSLPVIRKLHFHKFIFSHIFLFISFVSFLFIHQSFCFIKTDKNTCPLPLSWLWIFVPVTMYFSEIIYKYLFSHADLLHYIHHSSQVIELQIKPTRPTLLDNQIVGKIIWLCCKDVSYFEWHPFAITHYNYYNNTYSIIIKNRGNWTQKIFNALHYNKTLQLLYQGPLFNNPVHFISHVQQNPTIFITSGIGLTTFSSIFYKLLSLHLCCHLHTIIIAKSPDDVSWILDILTSLLKYKSPRFSVSFYFTDTTLLQLRNFHFKYTIGRPNLEREIFANSIYNNFSVHKQIYIYHSGHPSVTRTLKNLCKTKTTYIFKEIH